MVLRSLLCLLMSVPLPSLAQEVRDSNRETAQVPSRWSVGVAAAVRQGAYAGEDRRALIFPNLTYEGERFYWRGVQAGYHLVQHDGFVLDGFVAGRFDGIDADDFGARELAERGIDRDQLEDRDDAADAGISATWKGGGGELELDARADITGVSGGYQAMLAYRRPIRWKNVVLIPSLGARYLSPDLADYYYGTLDEEVARGVPDYRPGSVIVPHLGISLIASFARSWVLVADSEYRRWPDAIRDSPLVDRDADGTASLFVGLSRGF